MLFGEESISKLPEEVVEILIDNGVARSQWDALTKQIEVRGQLGNRLSAANKFKRLAQGLGLTGTTAATLWHVWYSAANKKATDREIDQARGVKRTALHQNDRDRPTAWHRGNGESFLN